MDDHTRETLDALGRRIATLAPRPPEPAPEPAADPDAPWRDWPAEEQIAYALTRGER